MKNWSFFRPILPHALSCKCLLNCHFPTPFVYQPAASAALFSETLMVKNVIIYRIAESWQAICRCWRMRCKRRYLSSAVPERSVALGTAVWRAAWSADRTMKSTEVCRNCVPIPPPPRECATDQRSLNTLPRSDAYRHCRNKTEKPLQL